MSKQPVLKNFVSEMDLFLEEFDKTHPELSPWQQKEIAKYKRLDFLRDVADRPVVAVKKDIWEGF